MCRRLTASGKRGWSGVAAAARPTGAGTAAAPRRHMATMAAPADAAERQAAPAVICYAVANLPPFDTDVYASARETMTKTDEVLVPPRDGKTFEVPAGHFFRIRSVEGPQVGDLNLWNADDLQERFYTSKTRQLHATHLDVGCRLWSGFPSMRPMAVIVIIQFVLNTDKQMLISRQGPEVDFVLKNDESFVENR